MSARLYRDNTLVGAGNYYSIKSQHQQAVVYFKRALKLNPRYHEAWTLAGHEVCVLMICTSRRARD